MSDRWIRRAKGGTVEDEARHLQLQNLRAKVSGGSRRPKLRYAEGGSPTAGTDPDKAAAMFQRTGDSAPPPASGPGQADNRRSKAEQEAARNSTKGLTPAMLKQMQGHAGGGWIKGAIKHKGALHRQLGVPEGQKIPKSKLAAAASKGGKLGQRARLAETLSKFSAGGVVRTGINGLAQRGHTKGRVV